VGRDEDLVVTGRQRPEVNYRSYQIIQLIKPRIMRTKKSRLGLSILAGSLSFVGAANAIDIVIDGSYETSTNNLSGFIGQGGNDPGGIDGGWTSFTTYTYSANYTQPGPAGCGQVYLRPYSPNQTVSQVMSLTRAITTAQIDGSQGQYTSSAWFSTYLGQNDYSDLTLQFLDESQAPIGSPVALGGATFVAALPGGIDLRAWGQDTKSGLVPPGARYASITTVSHALSGQPDGYVDLVSLDVTAGFVPVQVTASAPANNATGVSPGAVLGVTLADGTAPLNTNSVRFAYDGSPASAMIQQSAGSTTVQFQPPGLLASLSQHSYEVAFNNNGGATPNTTNLYSFKVAPYANVDLGPPLYLETFDELAEGALPAGWTVTNFTDLDSFPGYDLNNFHSDAFVDWTVVNRNTITNWFTVTPDGGDFQTIFNVAPNQVINNAVVTNLISSNSIIAISDRTSSSQKQIDYLFTGDYSLSGKASVYLSFHNIYIQNQNNIASVEYSINGGATWLPALYLLDGADILRNSAGNIDASNTFATVYGDVPNVDLNSTTDGYYGQYIGVKSNLWSTLAPFIQARGDDDQTGSKRVEIVRLAQADNQPAVRFRMAMAGRYAWYFGIDDFGLYSITSADPPVLSSAPTPAVQSVAVGNSATLSIASALGLGPFTYQWRHDGIDLPGETAQSLIFPNVSISAAGSYDVVVTGAGGAITSPPPAAVLNVVNPPVFVTGQWDFLLGNLAASYGADLQYSGTEGDTTFGNTTSFGISDINGVPTAVMHFTPSAAQWGGYKMFHGAAPNGGGAYVNQYTLIFDIYYPPNSDNTWRSLWQTDVSNGANNDGDLFVSTADGLGISSVYNGNVSAGAWHRIAAAFDLTGPGSPVLTKFIDGVKVGNQTSGLSGVDGRFALDPSALVFADNDGDVAEAYVSSIQFSNGRRPDAFLEALGGPSPLKIPGIIRADMVSGQIVIRWSGGVALQSADSLAGPWTTVAPAGQYTYTPSPLEQKKFYRPQIP
jgi:hypothetical protein